MADEQDRSSPSATDPTTSKESPADLRRSSSGRLPWRGRLLWRRPHGLRDSAEPSDGEQAEKGDYAWGEARAGALAPESPERRETNHTRGVEAASGEPSLDGSFEAVGVADEQEAATGEEDAAGASVSSISTGEADAGNGERGAVADEAATSKESLADLLRPWDEEQAEKADYVRGEARAGALAPESPERTGAGHALGVEVAGGEPSPEAVGAADEREATTDEGGATGTSMSSVPTAGADPDDGEGDAVPDQADESSGHDKERRSGLIVARTEASSDDDGDRPSGGPWREESRSTVQIRDYFAVVRRRLVWLVAIPAITMIGALLFLLPKPQQFRAAVDVTLPGTGSDVSPGTINQIVADYQQMVVSDRVLDEVSERTGVPKNRLLAGLNVKRLGTSSLMSVVYTGNNDKRVGTVAETTARVGLEQLYEPQVVEATSEVTAAQADIDEAQKAMDAFVSSNQLDLNPEVAYRAKQAALDQQRIDLAVAETSGFAERTAALRAIIDTTARELNDLRPLALEFQALRERHAQLREAGADAAKRQLAIRAEAEVARSPAAVSAATVKEESKIRTVARGMAVALIGGLAIAIGVVVLLEVLSSRGGRERARVGGGAGVNGPSPGEPTVEQRAGLR